MPGGCVLRVEPSDPHYKVTAKRSKSDSQTQHQPVLEVQSSVIEENIRSQENKVNDTKTSTEATVEKQSKELDGEANEEEDLDDFFASLE